MTHTDMITRVANILRDGTKADLTAFIMGLTDRDFAFVAGYTDSISKIASRGDLRFMYGAFSDAYLSSIQGAAQAQLKGHNRKAARLRARHSTLQAAVATLAEAGWR